jgi:flagellar biosynthesis protein FliR
MRTTSLGISASTLIGFLLVLCRVSGIFAFLPIPGLKTGADTARVFAVLAITISLYPLWPTTVHMEQSIGGLTAAVICEAIFGITIGLGVAFVMELLSMAAQVAGLQAGFGFASTIDPNTQSDSSILVVVAQTLAGLLFLATGLDREVIRIFASSLEKFPPGQFVITASIAEALVKLGGGIFSMGVRLALPVIALLGLVDLALALLGRLNAQLQLISLAFPVKMLAAMVLFAWIAAVEPRIFIAYAGQFLTVARRIAGGG